jgi:type II secretory pathway component PulF
MGHLGHWMPAFDLALIGAGEQSGRLDVVCSLLAGYYNDRSVILRRMISDLMYPVFVFHVAIFLYPFIDFIQHGNLFLYLVRTVGVVIPLYAAVYFLIYAGQGKRGAKWRAFLERVLNPVPILGTARRSMALSRLAAALEALLNAGVNVIQAWELAVVASGSPAIERAVFSWKPKLEAGHTPSEMVSASPQFPEMFANLYCTGEVSGKLDDSLMHLRKYYQEDGSNKLHLLGQWVPRGIYLIVAGIVALKVIGTYSAYLNELNSVLKM